MSKFPGCALVLPGGGARGAYQVGVLKAIDEMVSGPESPFGIICGTSAGAIAGAFFVTGKATEGSVMFYMDLNAEPFLDRSRLFRRQPAIDLDYLLGEAAVERGLDATEVTEHPVELYATVTPVDPDDRRRVLRVAGDAADLEAVLTATANLPVLAGGDRIVEGNAYVDGGLHEQCPWWTSASLGATHILVLPSRPVLASESRAPMSFVERLGVLPLIRRMHGSHVAQLVESLPQRSTYEAWSLRSIADGTGSMLTNDQVPWEGHLELVDLPESLPLPGRLETDRPRLVDALIGGAQAVVDHFDIEGFTVEPRVGLHHPESEVPAFRSEALASILAGQLDH